MSNKTVSTITNEQEANEEIASLILTAQTAIQNATKIADQYGIYFYFEGPGYGMGGTYKGKPPNVNCEEESWETSDEDYGWTSSSDNC